MLIWEICAVCATYADALDIYDDHWNAGDQVMIEERQDRVFPWAVYILVEKG